MVCNVCGTSNDWDAAFCIMCGKSLRSSGHFKRLFKRTWLGKPFLRSVLPVVQVLIDRSFHHRVSFRTIKWIYGLSILCGGFIALLFTIAGFHLSRLLGIVFLLVGAPLIFLLIVIYSRLVLELILQDHPPTDQVDQNVNLPQSTDEIEWRV